MKIIPICPFCSKPLVGNADLTDCYNLFCKNDGDHFYGARAATEEEARAILAATQKRLVDALSAQIALPIEQNNHAQLRNKVAVLLGTLAEAHNLLGKALK